MTPERNPSTGRWELPVPVEGCTYDAAHGVRMRIPVPVGPDATYREAVEAVRRMVAGEESR